MVDDVEELRDHLPEVGVVIDDEYGSWLDRSPSGASCLRTDTNVITQTA
jgi:hypothetical protein